MLNPRHKALLDEVRRRIELASDDPTVLNRDGRTSWRGPRVRRAVETRADDGPALVKYIRGVLRKRQSEDPPRHMRLGISSIALQHIEPGIRELATAAGRRPAAA